MKKRKEMNNFLVSTFQDIQDTLLPLLDSKHRQSRYKVGGPITTYLYFYFWFIPYYCIIPIRAKSPDLFLFVKNCDSPNFALIISF